MRRYPILILATLLLIAPLRAANEQIITGTLTDEVLFNEISVYAHEGQVLLAVTEEVSETLDPTLDLMNADTGELLLSNDDYGWNTLQAALVYQVPQSGTYSVVLSSAGLASSGDYRVRLTIGGEELLDNPVDRVEFSGPALLRETEHFLLHYTLEGADATTEDYLEVVAEALEYVWTVQVEDMGWLPPLPDMQSRDPRYNVYLVNVKEYNLSTTGVTVPYIDIGDNPQTRFVEQAAASSYFVLENDLAESDFADAAERQAFITATVAHEFNHASQFSYDAHEALGWYYEAAAVWMEMRIYPDTSDGWDYIPDVFATPEICLGVEHAYDFSYTNLDYGGWLLLQDLSDRFGPQFVVELWQNIARYEGFEALEASLATYDTTIPEALAHYHARNLARDYALPDDFDTTVWLANVINSDGDWTSLEEGVQELGAAFFQFKRPPGQYEVRFEDEFSPLELWSVGIHEDEAQLRRLGQGGIVDTTDMDSSYVMVFNPQMTDTELNCSFYPFALTVQRGSGEAPAPLYSFDAAHFLPPELE